MRLEITIEGVERTAQRLREIGALLRSLHGEVYIAGARNVRLWSFHAGPDARSKIPLRNPLFLHETGVGRMLEELRRAANHALANRPAQFERGIAKATAVVARSMQSNISLGRHASSGTRIATGRKMRALSKPYARHKAEEGKGGQPILVWSGELRDSIRSRVSRATGT